MQSFHVIGRQIAAAVISSNALGWGTIRRKCQCNRTGTSDLGSEASTQAKKLESSCNFMLKSTILLLYSFSKRQLSSCNYSTVSDCKSVVVEKFQVKLESLLRTSSWLDYFLWLMITWPDSNCRDWGTLISDFADQNMLSEFEGHWVTQNSCCQWASKHSIHRQYPAFTISSIGPGLSSNIWIL